MSMTSETLRLLITGDSDGAVKAFKKARDSADRDLGKAQDEAEKTSARLTKMGAASLAAGAVMVTALASTIKPASDLNEAVNVVGLTFGDSADEIVEWGKSAASSTGLAADAALPGAAAIGGLLQNVGFMQDESVELSKDLVTLAADMGSAFNMSTVDALEAIRSGLAGEAEPLKKFNVFLSEAAVQTRALEEGIWDGVGAMDEQEKALARLSIITEQTSAIQGDFANTNGDTANAAKVAAAEFRNFQAAIGTELLPIVSEALGFLNSLLGAFNKLPAPVKSLVGQVALFTTGILLAGGAALTMAARVKSLNVALSTMSTRLNMSKTALLGWAGAAGVAVALQQEWTGARASHAAAGRVADEAIKRGASEIENYTSILQGLAAASPDLEAALSNVDGGAAGLAARFAESGDEGAAFKEIFDGLGDAGITTGESFTAASDAAAALANATDDVTAAAEDAEGSTAALSGSVDSLYRNTSSAAGAADGLAGSFVTVRDVSAETATSVDEARTALEEFIEAIFDDGGARDLAQSIADTAVAAYDLVEAYKEVRTAEESGKPGDAARARADALSAEQGLIDEFSGSLAGAATDALNWGAETGATTDQVAAKFRENVAKIQANLDELPPKARAVIGDVEQAVNDAEAELIVQVEESGLDATMQRITAYLEEVRRNADIQVFVTPTYSSPAPSGGGGGGTVADPDFELAPIGRSTRRTRSFGVDRAGGSGGGDVVINLRTELDGRKVAESTARWSQQLGGLDFHSRGSGK